MHTAVGLHGAALDAVRPLVARVRPADLDRPTPCAGWTLHDLLAHMIGQDHGFAVAVTADVGPDAFGPRPWTGDVAVAHGAGLDAVRAAFSSVAAEDPDRAVLLAEFGGTRFPLTTVIGFHLLDTLVHGWDVAAALGVPVGYSPDLVGACREQARLVPDDAARTHAGSPFAPARPAPGTADAWDETLALLGRDPRWSAG